MSLPRKLVWHTRRWWWDQVDFLEFEKNEREHSKLGYYLFSDIWICSDVLGSFKEEDSYLFIRLFQSIVQYISGIRFSWMQKKHSGLVSLLVSKLSHLKIKRFSFDGFDGLEKSILEQLTNFTRLNQLRLFSVNTIGKEILERILISARRHLKEACFAGSKNLIDDSTCYALASCKNLTVLDVSRCPGITHLGFNMILKEIGGNIRHLR